VAYFKLVRTVTSLMFLLLVYFAVPVSQHTLGSRSMITLLPNYRDSTREVSGTPRAEGAEKWPLASCGFILPGA
jgi:hypothetical protein